MALVSSMLNFHHLANYSVPFRVLVRSVPCGIAIVHYTQFGMQASLLVLAYTLVSFDYFEVL